MFWNLLAIPWLLSAQPTPASQMHRTVPPPNCQVTARPRSAFTPPAPHPAQPPPDGRFYFGDEQLWVMLYPSWTGAGRKTNEGYRIKFPWFSRDISDEEVRNGARLLIRGMRIDASAPALIVEGPHVATDGDNRAIVSTLTFPTDGCWEVAAERDGALVKFVLFIEK